VAEPGCKFLDWDTAFFGRRIGRAEADVLTPAGVERVLAWGRDRAVECLYLLLRSDDPESHRLAERAGFVRVDDRYTLGRSLAGVPPTPPEGVRPFEPADLPALVAIARESHTDTRFFTDTRFDRERARRMYEWWVERDCGERPGDVLTAVHDGAAAGYVTCDRTADGEGQIGLIAVDRRARGRGLGGALVEAALARFAADGLAGCLVVTQGRNADALRLYRRHGFEVRRVEYWYHRWADAAAA
jgi:ribosomal protein S18 acetylase RimI-like enzyme